MTSKNVTVAPQLLEVGRSVTVMTWVSNMADSASAVIVCGDRTMFRDLFVRIIEYASQTPDLEVCGLVSTHHIYPVRNIAAHPENSFSFDPVQFVKIFYQIQKSSDEMLVGMFHSHPDGPLEPSKTDIQQAFYPEWIYFIVHENEVRAWRIMDGETTLLNLHGIR